MRGLFLIVFRSLSQHRLSTVVTAASVALGIGLVTAVFTVGAQTRQAFTARPVGFDAVLGARGSELQLVMNAVYHLDTSAGNLPWSIYEEVKRDGRVELAIPYAVGDSYRGFRIVGTTTDLFTGFEIEGRGGLAFASGEPFRADRAEAVIGSVVADRTGLRRGDTFRPVHGTVDDARQVHEEDVYTVVGVLDPTNSPTDRVVWIPIEGVFRMEGHVLRGAGEEFEAHHHEEIPDEHKEVSAVMLRFSSPQFGLFFERRFNRQGSVATLAWPIAESLKALFDRLGWVHRVLTLVAWLVVFVAAASILASIHNSMNERRREFAVLRALGARRRTVFAVIVLESASIAALGAALGWLVHLGLVAAAAAVVRRETGVVLDVFAFHPSLILVPAAMVILGALAGLLPAWKAYRTDVARNLVAAG